MTNLPMRYLRQLTSLTKSWLRSLTNGAMTKLETEWINEIYKSRLVILPGEDSYLSGVDVPVWKLIQQMANGVTEAELTQDHPGLTKADIRACSLFVYLRITSKI